MEYSPRSRVPVSGSERGGAQLGDEIVWVRDEPYAAEPSSTVCPSASSRLTSRRVSIWVFRCER
jgi:hypothetical protein